MAARKHHFVPQCYLKGFAVPRKKGAPKAHVFDRILRKTWEAGIDNVAFERDFNRIDADGLPIDAFEQMMSRFESDLAPALGRIIEARTLDNADDRAILLNFIALLHLRNPRLRETFRDFHERVAKTVMDIALSSRERWESQVEKATAAGHMTGGTKVSYEDMKDFIEAGQYKVEVSTNRHIDLEMKTFEKILPLLFARHWIVIRAPSECGGFITSDHPVSLVWSEPRGRVPIGLRLKGTEVVFPISTQLAVIGAFEIADGQADATHEIVADMNGTIALFAERQVYSRDMNFAYRFDEKVGIRKASKLIGDRRFTQPEVKSNNNGEDAAERLDDDEV